MLYYESNTPEKMHSNRSATIVLAWLKERKKKKERRKKKKDNDLASLATCRWGTPALVSSNTNNHVADENTGH